MDCQLHGRWLAAGLWALLGAGCAKPSISYVTEHGLGPDKWATAWLLTHRVNPGAQLSVVPIGQPLPKGIVFDAPGASILRRGTLSAFEIAVKQHQLQDADIVRFGRIVHDIEIGAWAASQDPDSPVVEQAFRSLQQRYGRDTVPQACYFAFFGDLDRAIATARKSGRPIAPASLATDCEGIATKPALGKVVAEVPIPHLLNEIKRGKKVVFVDVREADEFAEAHIPGALNVPIRDKDQAIAQLRGADYVVSYCIKDFRGFEMAKALKDAGVETSVILNPYGIRGWVAEGLPTVGSKGMTSVDGERRLAECAASPDQCRTAATGGH